MLHFNQVANLFWSNIVLKLLGNLREIQVTLRSTPTLEKENKQKAEEASKRVEQ